MFDIWHETNDLAESVYSKDNYLVRVPKTIGGGYCIIYCSSNDIWYPNEEEAFRRSFIEGDYYEWMKVGSELASKEIFIRDIYKSWYVTGINNRIDSIDKLADFLKGEAGDLPIVCIGSSSGGYLAALLGLLLDAEFVISFSAQWELRNNGAMGVNPFLQRYESDGDRRKYYDLKPLLANSVVPIFYIVPVNNSEDYSQLEHIQGVECVKSILFNSRHHGVVVPKGNLHSLISMPLTQWILLYESCKGKIISPIRFSIQNEGVIKTCCDLWRVTLKKIKKKLCFSFNGKLV